MNTNYVYPSAQVGEFRQALLYAAGPASYSQATGDPVYNPGANEYIIARFCGGLVAVHSARSAIAHDVFVTMGVGQVPPLLFAAPPVHRYRQGIMGVRCEEGDTMTRARVAEQGSATRRQQARHAPRPRGIAVAPPRPPRSLPRALVVSDVSLPHLARSQHAREATAHSLPRELAQRQHLRLQRRHVRVVRIG